MTCAHVRARLSGLVLALAVLGVGCTPATSTSNSPSGQPAPARVKTLVFATDAEPELVVTGMGDHRFNQLRDAVHQHLAAYDDRGDVRPQLALEIPSRAYGTWVIRADGTMQTTYQLRPNVTWHDGMRVTAQDFVFGWTLATDPALPIESRSAASEIAHIDTPDAHTLVIEWKGLYAQAHAIINDDLGPFASHLLKGLYGSDKQQMWSSPYWTTNFMGVGPFRMAEWRRGEQIRLEAYDGFFAGRPRIDQILIRFIPSQDAILAHQLAGTVDKGVGKGGGKIQQQMYLKDQWERAGQKPTVFLSTSTFQHVWVQFREPVFPELTDVRVRKGLLLALDRQTLADALSYGLAPVAEAFLPPDDVRWDWVKDVVVKYPYDPRQAEALFAQAGLRRGADGVIVDSAGIRMVLPHWTTPGSDHEQQLAIEGDQWRQVGVVTQQVILSGTQANDRRTRSAFPGLNNAGWPSATIASIEGRFLAANCPSERNDWSGQNYGCFVAPTWEPIISRLKAAIDPEDQRVPFQELARLYTNELPLLPLYFDVSMEVFREGITGVKGNAKPDGSVTWNIADWDIV